MTSPLLAQLQRLDGELDRARERLAELARLLGDRASPDAADERARAAQRSSAEGRPLLHHVEVAVKSLETRIAKPDQRLDIGRIAMAK